MKMFEKSISWKLFPLLIAGVLICSIGIWFGIPLVLERGVKNDAVANAQTTVKQFKILRSYYTKNIVKKALASKALKPSYSHKDTPGEIPLPATLIHDLSELLTKAGTTLKLYSPYPFPVRGERQLDSFGKQAWSFLKSNPEQPFVKAESTAESEIVRVAIADTMVSKICVNCHNTRADTPKNDWKLKDLRGVLEINTDIGPALARGTWTARIIALAVVAVLGLVLLVAYRCPPTSAAGPAPASGSKPRSRSRNRAPAWPSPAPTWSSASAAWPASAGFLPPLRLEAGPRARILSLCRAGLLLQGGNTGQLDGRTVRELRDQVQFPTHSLDIVAQSRNQQVGTFLDTRHVFLLDSEFFGDTNLGLLERFAQVL